MNYSPPRSWFALHRRKQRLAVTANTTSRAPTFSYNPRLSTLFPVVGTPVTVDTGTVDAYPAPTFTFQWYRDDVTIIVGQTGVSYTPVSGNIGHTLRCLVTADNGVGSPATAYSNTSGAVA